MKWLCIALAATGCAHLAGQDGGSLRRSLLQADLDFAHEVALRGTEAWAETFADDGIMLSDGGGTIRGKEKIRAAMAALGDPRKAPGKVQIRWTPLGAEVSQDGTLGWTYGNAVIASGKSREKLKYVTVWRRVGETWKAVADIGNSGLADPGIEP